MGLYGQIFSPEIHSKMFLMFLKFCVVLLLYYLFEKKLYVCVEGHFGGLIAEYIP